MKNFIQYSILDAVRYKKLKPGDHVIAIAMRESATVYVYTDEHTFVALNTGTVWKIPADAADFILVDNIQTTRKENNND